MLKRIIDFQPNIKDCMKDIYESTDAPFREGSTSPLAHEFGSKLHFLPAIGVFKVCPGLKDVF